MAKKRSMLTTFVVALISIAVMLTLIPLPVNATTTNSKAEINMGIVTADYLNVRAEPSTNFNNIVGFLKKGTFVEVTAIVSAPTTVYETWLKINYYGEIAYVAKKYVDYIDVSQNDTTTNSIVELENCRGMTTASTLNLRFQPTTNSDKITSFDQYTYIDVLEIIYTSDSINPVWLKVQYDHIIGYVSKKYVKILVNEPVNTSDVFGTTTGYVRLRTNPTTTSQVKEIISLGTCLTVLDSVTTCNQYEKWYKVQSSNGNIGWVAGEYLKVGKWTLASTTRTWTSSDRNRNSNISLACSYINGQIIASGKDFSWFESVLGACSAEKGFLPATIYLNGAHAEGYGGGVCQVSTTINMAIKKLGIKTEVCTHSLPVRYASKEDEATVSYPDKNFSFTNTLQTPIMLEMIATSASCTCNVYVLQ